MKQIPVSALLIVSFLAPLHTYAESPKKDELQALITQEAEERMEADDNLQSAIDTEGLIRKTDDEVLQEAIGAEALKRETEDITIQAAIDAEIDNREELDRQTRFFNPPPGISDLTRNCLVGSLWYCVNLDGVPTLVCPLPGPCDYDDPNHTPDNPSLCPGDCEELGRVVVPDLATTVSCDSLIAEYVGFICMTPEEYDMRPSCQEGTVLNYYSDRGGWFCDPVIPPVVHIATDVYDLVGTVSLFERARVGSIAENLQALQNQINDITPVCVCPGEYSPVCAMNGITYLNNCEAECAGQPVIHVGLCQ